MSSKKSVDIKAGFKHLVTALLLTYSRSSNDLNLLVTDEEGNKKFQLCEGERSLMSQ